MTNVKESNLEKLSKQKFGGKSLEWKISKNLGPAFQWVEDKDTFYTNRKGTDVIYVQPKSPQDAKAICYGCGNLILMKIQYDAVWLDESAGLGPCAGTGEVINDYARWCPKCEKESSKRGVIYKKSEDL